MSIQYQQPKDIPLSKNETSNSDDSPTAAAPHPLAELEEEASTQSGGSSTFDSLPPVPPESEVGKFPVPATTSSADVLPASPIQPEKAAESLPAPTTTSSKLKLSRGPEGSGSSSSNASKRHRQSPDRKDESTDETSQQNLP
ncbi:hypothetical protein BDZ45DRAFT_719815 [Acephala macrosclerotiorum]|nr:hypothetical protein BDZ45DRAFT_719815 [Acephala macrosclerotiorum]